LIVFVIVLFRVDCFVKHAVIVCMTHVLGVIVFEIPRIRFDCFVKHEVIVCMTNVLGVIVLTEKLIVLVNW